MNKGRMLFSYLYYDVVFRFYIPPRTPLRRRDVHPGFGSYIGNTEIVVGFVLGSKGMYHVNTRGDITIPAKDLYPNNVKEIIEKECGKGKLGLGLLSKEHNINIGIRNQYWYSDLCFSTKHRPKIIFMELNGRYGIPETRKEYDMSEDMIRKTFELIGPDSPWYLDRIDSPKEKLEDLLSCKRSLDYLKSFVLEARK